MKIIFALFLFAFVSLNCLAKCEVSDSDSIESRISYQKNLEERKERQTDEPKELRGNTNLSNDIRRNGSSDSDFDTLPLQALRWGIGFSEGLAKIVVNGKSGFINRKGQIVIKPQYKLAGCFSEGLAAVEIEDKWGFINQKGELVIPAKFDAADNFSEGLALVRSGALWGYINGAGEFAIEPKFGRAKSFSEGFAAVGNYENGYVWTTHKRPNGKWVDNFIDKSGKVKFAQNFDGIYENFNGGMALVGRNIGYNNGVIVESYFIDVEGRELWNWDSNLTSFSEDLIVVTVDYDKETKFEKYSFLDRNGKRVTEKVYDHLKPFSEGLAVATIDGKDGFIDKSGEFVIEPKFSSAGSFSEGLAPVWKDNKSGFIDKRGNWRITLKFNDTDGFSKGFAAVETAIGSEFSYIDKTGKFIWKPAK